MVEMNDKIRGVLQARRDEWVRALRELADVVERAPLEASFNSVTVGVHQAGVYTSDPDVKGDWLVWPPADDRPLEERDLEFLRSMVPWIRDGARIGEVEKISHEWGFGAARKFPYEPQNGRVHELRLVVSQGVCHLEPVVNDDGEPVYEERKVRKPLMEPIYEDVTELVPKMRKVCPSLTGWEDEPAVEVE